jgi:hypothetical protein
MHDRFESSVRLLLSGEFICSVSHPEEFRYLKDDGVRTEIDHYLLRIGRKLTTTSHGSGYFLAFTHCGEIERTAIKAQFTEIKGTLSAVATFFRLVMRATGREDLLMHGAMIESSVLMAQIDQDPALRNELQTVSNLFKQNEGSNRQIFDRILGRLKNSGYLQLVNAERGLYQVTSKVEYLLDIIRFLQENDETLKGKSDESDEGQGSANLL